MKIKQYERDGMGNTYVGFKVACPKCGKVLVDYNGIRLSGTICNYCPRCGEELDFSSEEYNKALRDALAREDEIYGMKSSEDEIDDQIDRIIVNSQVVIA